jgi:hypothetical protein
MRLYIWHSAVAPASLAEPEGVRVVNIKIFFARAINPKHVQKMIRGRWDQDDVIVQGLQSERLPDLLRLPGLRIDVMRQDAVILLHIHHIDSARRTRIPPIGLRLTVYTGSKQEETEGEKEGKDSTACHN